ncbi:MAG: hypothetical protein ACE5F1_07190 [Planctomycetota bacterium]
MKRPLLAVLLAASLASGAARPQEPIDPPGDGRPLAGLHPSDELATVRPEGFEPRV